MKTNIELIASRLRISNEAAIGFYSQIRGMYDTSITTYMVRKGIELWLDQNPNERPSPTDLVRLFQDIIWERKLDEEIYDYIADEWIAQQEREEWDELPWPEEEREIMYLATYGYRFGQRKALQVPSYQSHKESQRHQIQEICRERGITSLVHFSRRGNLENILRMGLLCRSELDNSSLDGVMVNDQFRHDQQQRAICLSISFPNYKMFYRLSLNDRTDWVILELDASILWELDCAFCHANAASRSVRSIPLEQRKQASALESLFADYQESSRFGLPPNYTTHPQAEVLVFDPIPTGFFKAVYFWDNTSLHPWNKGDNMVFWCHFKQKRDFFRPRVDYANWPSADN